MGKKTRGRQKIPIVKMQNEVNLQVTFSKRRAGLFKKASEICTLCDAEVALIVFSPGDKAYGFGHSSVQEVVDRFLAGDTTAGASQQQGINHDTLDYMEMHRKVINQQLNLQLGQIHAELETEKKRGKVVDEAMKEAVLQCQWKAIGECNQLELARMHAKMEGLKRNLSREAERILMHNATGATSISMQPFFPGDGTMATGPSGLPPAMSPYEQMMKQQQQQPPQQQQQHYWGLQPVGGVRTRVRETPSYPI